MFQCPTLRVLLYFPDSNRFTLLHLDKINPYKPQADQKKLATYLMNQFEVVSQLCIKREPLHNVKSQAGRKKVKGDYLMNRCNIALQFSKEGEPMLYTKLHAEQQNITSYL